MNEVKNTPAYFFATWFNALLSEIDATNVTKVALKMGVSRPTLSIFINGKGQYGNGKASPANMEIRYRQAFEQLTCPHTNALVGVKHCRETALRIAPTHNPLQLVQWQACQNCKFKPAPIAQVEVPKQAKAAKAVLEPVQQAGIIDKVTLPLPEVGAPQIADHTTQEAA